MCLWVLDKAFSNLDFCRRQTIFVDKLIVRGLSPCVGQQLLVIWSGFRPAPFCYLEIVSKSSGCASHASIALTSPLLAFAAIVSPMVILRLCWHTACLRAQLQRRELRRCGCRSIRRDGKNTGRHHLRPVRHVMLLGVGTGLPGLYDPIRQCHRFNISERDCRQHGQCHIRQCMPALRQNLC